MRMQLLTLTCVLSAAACGGSTANQQAANDPSTTSSGSASVTSAPIVTAGSTDNQSNAALNTNPAPVGGAMAAPAGASTNMAGAAVTPAASGGASVGATPVSAGATVDQHPALTPMNQGNSADETKITAAIRKAVMADKSLSFGAKNVKVITVGTKVTLRGNVKSDQERTTIENDARNTAGVTDVDNQLQVKN